MQHAKSVSIAATRRRSFWWRLLLSCAMAVTAIGTLPNLAQPAAALSSNIVISQVYGGGGNSGATYKNDFIELFNRGVTPQSLNGWSVQYASAGGTTWQVTNLTDVTLQPGEYYLVQEAAGAGGTTDLPTPDVTGNIAMSGTAGKVALVNTTAALAGSGTGTNGLSGAGCPTSPTVTTVVDFVGFGSGTNCSETSSAPAPSNTNAILRAGTPRGATETDNNATDFATGTPNPRDPAPKVVSTSPAAGTPDAANNANIVVTFSEPVTIATPPAAFAISCTVSNAHPFAISGGTTTYTLDPTTNFTTGELCTVTITAAEIRDADTNDPPDQMVADYTFSFTIGTRIRSIQGAGHLSPLVGTSVVDVPGVVTVVITTGSSRGFYFQDPVPDANTATSEGIFVFTGSTSPSVAVGNGVTVNGMVTEFRPGNTATSLTITQITNPSVTVVAPAASLPATTIIGAAGRIPPKTVIEDDATGDVETSGTFDPGNDGIDFYESLEGMLVQVDDAVATGPTNSFGEISVLPDGGAGFGTRTTRGGIVVQPGDFNPERVILDDVLAPTSVVNTGDRLAPVSGILSYDFGNYKLLVTSTPTVTPGGIAREVTSVASAPNSVTVATFNVENLDPGDGAGKFDQLAGIVVNNLLAPDIIALEEIQDDNGPTSNGVVAADQTFAALIAAIQRSGGPTYQYRQINPVDSQDGGEPGGNIRVGFLFRTDRGVSFVDRPGGTSSSAVGVAGTGAATQLTFSPGRIDPTNSAFNASRKPLAGEFNFNGRSFFVVANHFNSKGGDQPLFGRYQPSALSSEAQRRQQAQIVHDFVQQLLTADPNANVVVLGDLNDFQFSAPLNILQGTGQQLLYALINTLPAAEQYTYVFDGNSQALDHILVSPNLFRGAAVAYDVVHVNAEFADQISDHDPQVARFTLSSSTPNAGTVNVATAQNTAISIVLSGTAANGDALQYTIVSAPTQGTLSAVSGDRVTYTPNQGYSGPDSFTYRVTENGVASNTATVNITVAAPTTPIYPLDISASGSGTVTPGSGSYTAGQTVTLAATPAGGNVFIGWTIDNSFAGFANPLSITMNAKHTVVAAFAPATGFSDVSSGTPYSEAILRLAARRIIRGYADGTFAPTDVVTRAQSAALIARAVGWDAEDHGNPFIDRCDPANPADCMDDDLWRNVGTLAFYNVARGYDTGEYRPRDGVTHIQVISFITRAMVAKGYWVQATTDDPSVYPNIPADSPHRFDLVTFVKYAGAIPDRPTGQAWQDWEGPSSRGWYAEVLDRALRSRFATTP